MKTGLINTSVASLSPGAARRAGNAGGAPPDAAGWAQTMHDAVARKSGAPPSDSQPKTAPAPAHPAHGPTAAPPPGAQKTGAHTPDRKAGPTSSSASTSHNNQASDAQHKKKTATTPVAAPPVTVPVPAQASSQRPPPARSDAGDSPARTQGTAASDAKKPATMAQATSRKPGRTAEKTTAAATRVATAGQPADDSRQPTSRPPATPRAPQQGPDDSAKTPAPAMRSRQSPAQSPAQSPGQPQRQGTGPSQSQSQSQGTSGADAAGQPLSGSADSTGSSAAARNVEHAAGAAGVAQSAAAGQGASSEETAQIARPARRDEHGLSLASNGAGAQYDQGVGTLPSPASAHAGLKAGTPATAANPAPATPATPINPQTLASLNAQIHTLHNAGGGQTRIDLHPASLGSVQIHVQMQGQQQAQVSFNAAQATTAQAIQESLPQLVASMQQQGIQLAQPQVHIQNNMNSQNAPGHPGQSSMGQPQGQQQGQSQNPGGAGGRQQPQSALAAQEVAARDTAPESATKAGVRAYA